MREVYKVFVSAVLATVILVQPIFADKRTDYLNTYNFKRASEMIDENKLDDAVSYFKAEVSDHRDNGYAYAMIGYILNYQEKYGEALTNLNLALKYLSKKDVYYSFALRERAGVYRGLGDEKSALADMNARVKLFKKDPDSYADRAQYYVDIDDYSAALKDFETAIALEPGESQHYVGRGVCLRNMEKYAEALACYDYALKLEPIYSTAYMQRGYCKMLMKDYKGSAEDYVKSLDLDGNNAAFYGMQSLADSAFEAVDFRLKIMQMSEPLESYWPYCRAVIYERSKKYSTAIELYEKSNKISYNALTSKRIAECKSEMGDNVGALSSITDALKVDSSDTYMLLSRAEYQHRLGMKSDCYGTMNRIIEMDPMDAQMHYWKGWYENCNGDDDAAIEDLGMAIMIFPEYIRAHNVRGCIYMKKGMLKEAEADFKKVLEVDTVDGYYFCAPFAHFYLGDREKAFACLQSNLNKDSIGNFYDAACLYSLAKESERALYYFRRTLETGYTNFHHVDQDSDLDYIRNTQEFKDLVDEYRSKLSGTENLQDDAKNEAELKAVEIPFTHEGGVTKIKCNINGLPLSFVFDTGAADVAISTVEATFMLKNGYLSERDIVGKQKYMSADGNISEGTVIVLRKVMIGELELTDVKASVSSGISAPLLLGQSVLQRLGSIEIDNKRDVIKVVKK